MMTLCYIIMGAIVIWQLGTIIFVLLPELFSGSARQAALENQIYNMEKKKEEARNE